MRWRAARCLLAMLPVVGAACSNGVKVEFFEIDGQRLSASEQRSVERIARTTLDELRRLPLPGLPDEVVIRVQPGNEVIPETGETGTAVVPNTIVWIVDPRHPGGVEQVARTWLRASLYHELHHLVRDAAIDRSSMLDVAVTEGMATAFERDYAGVHAPWGDYPADVDQWVEQLRALPKTAERKPWLLGHPDGRRWIAYKVGTYLVDRALRASGKSPAELVIRPTEEILQLATQPSASGR
ncbi:MAG TPA: DUF2268 domain-containing putative Zn-dependent protease [Polyangiales bacterium]|nr:DUF2268 domain-containing putative Zn-dependent protease [Polyangiales bacterium]